MAAESNDAMSTGTLKRAPWQAVVISLFPAMFPGPLGFSVVGNALSEDRWRLKAVDLRQFGIGRHKVVDDSPAGGGAGMVIRADVAAAALDEAAVQHPELPLVYLTPRGRPLTQDRVRSLAAGPGAIVLAGRFEGLDQRVIDARSLEELSVGDFVLSGGEIAAMALIDACARLLPGTLGAPESLAEESFEQGLLEYPLYTRPRSWEGREIPSVLLSGDHTKIAAWRRSEAEKATEQRRPDLWTGRRPARA